MDNDNQRNFIPLHAQTAPDSGFTFQRLTFGDLVIEGAWVKDAAAAKLLNQTMALASMRRPLRGANDPMREFGPRYLLSDEIKQYVRALKIEQVTAAHIRGVETSLAFLLHITGDIPVCEITKTHILATFELIKQFPSNPRREVRFKDKSIAEILELTKDEPKKPMAPGTLQARLSHYKAFFSALLKEPDKLTVSPVAAADLRFTTARNAQSERVFSTEDLEKIFDPATFSAWAKLPHRWWVPMLALYTGARVQELSQLRVADVMQMSGIWTLRIRSYGANTVKSEGSNRDVPVAAALIEAGILNYIEDIKRTGHPRLFPHLKRGESRTTQQDNGIGYGAPMTAQFSKYVGRLQLQKGRTMHSFRHYFIDTLRRAGASDAEISKLTGHDDDSGASQHVAAIRRYQGDLADVLLTEAVATLAKFKPRANLIPYQRGQFASVLADTTAFHP